MEKERIMDLESSSKLDIEELVEKIRDGRIQWIKTVDGKVTAAKDIKEIRARDRTWAI